MRLANQQRFGCSTETLKSIDGQRSILMKRIIFLTQMQWNRKRMPDALRPSRCTFFRKGHARLAFLHQNRHNSPVQTEYSIRRTVAVHIHPF